MAAGMPAWKSLEKCNCQQQQQQQEVQARNFLSAHRWQDTHQLLKRLERLSWPRVSKCQAMVETWKQETKKRDAKICGKPKFMVPCRSSQDAGNNWSHHTSNCRNQSSPRQKASVPWLSRFRMPSGEWWRFTTGYKLCRWRIVIWIEPGPGRAALCQELMIEIRSDM